MTDETLSWIRDRFNAIPSVTHWRIHTRAPVHYPVRVTESLISGLAVGKPCTLVTHFNHANEITAESARIASLCDRHGILLKNQAVLLNGVNDSVQAQLALWQGLHKIGIAAYYLHHPDPVPGNAHFRLSLERGLALFDQVERQIPCPAPRYVIDQPDGAGKIPVRAWLKSQAVNAESDD